MYFFFFFVSSVQKIIFLTFFFLRNIVHLNIELLNYNSNLESVYLYITLKPLFHLKQVLLNFVF